MAQKTKCSHSGGLPIVVVQHSTETFSPLDHASVSYMTGLGTDQSVAQTRMVALSMIMGDELRNGGPQGFFSEQDQAFQAGFFDAAHKSLGISIEIGGVWR